MRAAAELAEESLVWGPGTPYDDTARFEYGCRLWKDPTVRSRWLAHRMEERHPCRERFLKQRALMEILDSTESVQQLDRRLRERGSRLRGVVREIPPVFGWFF